MRLLSLFVFCVLCATAVFAQKQNNNWVFGNNNGLSFNTDPPGFISTHWSRFPFVTIPCAVSDAGGNLLFYSNGDTVWDRNHNVMPNGTDIGFTPDPCRSGSFSGRFVDAVAILPYPGDPDKYFIFANAQNCQAGLGRYTQVKYSIVDMSLNNGLGDVLLPHKNILLDTAVTRVSVAAGNGICDKWVLFQGHVDRKIHAYRITTGGIQTSPVVSPDAVDTIYFVKCSNDNKKIVYSTVSNGFYKVRLADFDAATGIVSNHVTIDSTTITTSIRGVAFSADNSKLYYYDMSGARPIAQVDISLPNIATIRASKTVVKNVGPFDWSWDIMLGPDGKIYCGIYMATGSPGPEDFAVINHPDRAGPACDVTELAVPGPIQAQKPTVYNFHNAVPATDVQYSYSDFNFCTLPATLRSQQQGAASYLWSTGATTASISIAQNGTYWVRATQACGAYRVDTFHVQVTPIHPFADTFSCNGQPIQLPLDAGATYSWQTQGPVITESGTYAVTISKGVCGTVQDTFRAIVYPPLGTPILPADTIVCNPAMSLTVSCLYDMGSYEWSTGATGRSAFISQPGTYWLRCYTPCGLFTDTIHISFCAPEIGDIRFTDRICSGSCINFTASVNNFPQSYTWSFTGGDPAFFSGETPVPVCYYQAGAYTATLTVANAGGTATESRNVTVLPKPEGRFEDTMVTVPYKTLLLLPACADAEEVNWYKGDELVCSDCRSLQVDALYHYNHYVCVVKNGDCIDQCSYTVAVTGIPRDCYLPTAFSPNGDGRNDRFRIITDNPNIYLVRLAVYNRYGDLVYHATDNDRGGWDGYYNSKMAEMGTYYWSLKYRVLGSYETLDMKGDVTLVR